MTRAVIMVLTALLITGLLGAAPTLQATAAASGPSGVTDTSTVVEPTRLHAAAPAADGAKTPTPEGVRAVAGCPGPDSLCDIGGEIVDCATQPTKCADHVTGSVGDGVADGVRGGLNAACGLVGVCDGGGLPGLPGGLPSSLPGGLSGVLPDVSDLFGGGIPGLGDIPNPFTAIGDVIAKAAADAWTAAMLAIWNSGLFVLRIVLTFSEYFMTPDLSGDGPGRDVYSYMLWLALGLVVILVMIQLGATAFKREGKGLARAMIGCGQFVVVCASWFGYCVTLVAACSALTHGLMKALLNVNTWPEWDPLNGLGAQDIGDATVATVLAFFGVFLWIAAIGHIFVYLARAAALLILTATGPLSAAGLVSEFTRAWFWKSLRWLHAAAFTPVLMVMVLGIGVQMSSGVSAHLADDTAKTVGTALPAVMLILISVVAPMALFKMLAFVDPSSPSGASFRQGMAAVGGVQGLLGGAGGSGSSTAASATDANGRSGGEQSADEATGARFNKSAQGVLGNLGPAGQAMSKGLGVMTGLGSQGASLFSDVTNQAGVGESTYGPDLARDSGSGSGGSSVGEPNLADSDRDDFQGGTGTGANPAGTPPTPASPSGGGPSPASGTPATTPASTGGSGGTGAAGSGAAAGAGGVPPAAV